MASYSGKLSTDAPSDGDRAQLLKLAALKSAQNEAGSADPAMAAAVQLSTAPAPSVEPPAKADDQSSAAMPSETPAVADASAVPAGEAPIQMAYAEPAPADGDGGTTVVPMPPAAPTRGGSALININRASTESLDRFPGAGHIGHAIVSHRPYRSIADLVRKRVLTTSDFHKIQGRISVD